MVTVLIASALGFLTGLGVGGGSLLLIWLTLGLNMDPTSARGINLLFFLPAALISCIFRKQQGKIDWQVTFPAAAAGALSAVLFTVIRFRTDTDLLKKAFGILLLFTGFREIFHNNSAPSGHPSDKGGENMIEQDTIRLLRECDAGVTMGVASIDDVLEHVESQDYFNALTQCKQDHEVLRQEIQQLLDRYQDQGKKPNPIAKQMSHMKTGMKLTMQETDATIADLMTDGCNMGTKSLSRYLNQYKAADEQSKDIAKRLIAQEDRLAMQSRPYL